MTPLNERLNRPLLQELRDFITKHPSQFNMSIWFESYSTLAQTTPDQAIHNCGTIGCIGGWTGVLVMNKIPGAVLSLGYNGEPEYTVKKAGYSVHPDADSEDLAGLALGMTEEESTALFCPEDYQNPNSYPFEQALRTINHLLATGEIDWSI